MLFLLDPPPHVLVMLDQSGDRSIRSQILRPELAPALPTHGVQLQVLFDAATAVVVLAGEGAGIVEELVAGNESRNTKSITQGPRKRCGRERRNTRKKQSCVSVGVTKLV
jgi:hypothetical protein